MTKLQPREIGLIAAALALVADQGSKLFMLYGAGLRPYAAGQPRCRSCRFLIW